MATQGYIVACVDGRGTGGRGEEFTKCTYMNLGVKEAQDQAETGLSTSINNLMLITEELESGDGALVDT